MSSVGRAGPTRGGIGRDLIQTLVVTLALVLAFHLAVQNFQVDGHSMDPTYHDGELILVDKLSYHFTSPARGDVIVFQAVPARQPDRDYIKRVIGLPGDIVAVHSGAVYLNGRRLGERYIAQAPLYRFGPERVPSNDYFVLGDNRNNSYDSSRWAAPWLARKYIIGRAFLAYWPPSNVGFLGASMTTDIRAGAGEEKDA